MAGKGEVYYFLYLVLVFTSIDAIDAICDRSCRPYPDPQKSLQFKCRRRSERMFYLDVRCSKTDDGQCNGRTECSGLQQEVLRQVAEECYWERKCNIVMNKIFPNIINLQGQCINLIPNVFESRALCVRKKKLKDFYQDSLVGLKDGVVRISSSFPWDYSNNDPIRTITFPARQDKKLRVTFLEVDLDSSTDHLNISTSETSTIVTRDHRDQNLDFSGNVQMEFAVGSSSRSGKGFVFCFYWLDAGIRSGAHACDLVGGVKCLPGKVARKRRRKNRNSNRNNSAQGATS